MKQKSMKEEVQATETETTKEVSKQPTSSLQTFDLNGTDLPDLDQAEEMPINLMSDYWTPEATGENRRVFFDRLEMAQVLDMETGETNDLLCAYFFWKNKDGEVMRIRNGSARLVGLLGDANIQRGTPLSITYVGKKQNRTNSFKSDNWSVKPLIVKQQ